MFDLTTRIIRQVQNQRPDLDATLLVQTYLPEIMAQLILSKHQDALDAARLKSKNEQLSQNPDLDAKRL